MEEARDKKELDMAIELTERMFYKEYLTDITNLSTPEDIICKDNKIRILKLNKFVFHENEDNIEKLTNVLIAINALKATYGYIIHSDEVNIEIYLMIKTEDVTAIGKDTIYNGLKGNFPGVELENIYENEIESVVNNKLFTKNFSDIVSLVTIPSEKSDKLKVNIQGLEKFIDSMLGQEFTVLVLAEALTPNNIKDIRKGYEDIYTMITPFKATDFSFNENEAENISTSLAESITNTVTNTTTKTNGISDTKSVTNTVGGSVTAGLEAGPFSASVSATYSRGVTKGTTVSESDSVSNGKTEGNTKTDTKTEGSTKGEGRTYSFKTENKTTNELLKRIDLAIDRIAQSEDVGLYNFGVYFLSNSKDIAYRAATTYMGVVKGEKSGLEKSYINIWEDSNVNYQYVFNNLKKFTHPIFVEESKTLITPTTLINSRELARATNFPYKSVPGIPAINITPFSRNISTYEKQYSSKVSIGNIFHMGQIENTPVDIDINSLTMHTFITGSTGSGKTNACCKLIDEVINKNVKVLIIEPTKGEYKNIFGNSRGFRVLGTNPNITELLKINPFKFPKNIHILEHVDRLIEIFNVCWPMYAAMPAVLKDAVLQAYEVCGWDLLESKNVYAEDIFPTFEDLQTELINVIEDSAYSQELKSNYTGSLATRVKSLTNGLNGQIFSSSEIDNNILFDSNVIVDLSRVGSLETKALIMGILIMRLNEHRMSYSGGMNLPLRHITVLEEAHNILKRTSTEQSTEGANLSGKSVEMLSNAIAEMRTYGEGFIIADQSPNAVDVSAIRNTNTKIIMRLPDEADRRVAGKSAALKDEQLDEITKLPKGVAVVYQNDWIEPVLCKISKFEGKETPYVYDGKIQTTAINDIQFKSEVMKLLLKGRISTNTEINLEIIEKNFNTAIISTKNKIRINYLLEEYKVMKQLEIWNTDKFDKLSELITEVLNCKCKTDNLVLKSRDFTKLTNELENFVRSLTIGLNNEMILAICHSMMKEASKASEDRLEIYSAWRKYIDNGGALI